MAITGLPGVGKTELCNQIAHKAREMKAYKGVFWLSAATGASIESGLIEMARQMKLYNETDVDIEKLRQLVVNELNREESWLLVLDNINEVDPVKTILPEKRGNRHVLITTRDRETSIPRRNCGRMHSEIATLISYHLNFPRLSRNRISYFLVPNSIIFFTPVRLRRMYNYSLRLSPI